MAKKKIKKLNQEIEKLKEENRRLNKWVLANNFAQDHHYEEVNFDWINVRIYGSMARALGEDVQDILTSELLNRIQPLIAQEVKKNIRKMQYDIVTDTYNLELGVALKG